MSGLGDEGAHEELTLERCFAQADFDRFATLSGDDNPIHVDPAHAAGTRFGATVAHGLLLVGTLLALAQRLRPGARVSEHEVMFPAPTFTGETVRFDARVIGEAGGAVSVALEARSFERDEVTCTGTCTLAP